MNDRYKAMLFQRPEYIPITMGILPSAWKKYREELTAITRKHPVLFGTDQSQRDYDAIKGTYVEGSHTDAWGCVWENIHTGREAIVKHHPYPTRESVRGIKQPEKDMGFPHGFMYLRLADLRGFEELMIDFAEEPPELQLLIDTVLEYNIRQVKLWIEKNRAEKNRIVYFGDDLGMQTSLPMSPEKWRKYLKPCYKKIYKLMHDAGHYIYMHTDGHIHEIIPDLVECGVNIINPQIRANGLDNLVRVCKGKVCVALDLDRQMFPFCRPSDMDPHVREAVEKLGSPEGGLILVAEVDDGVPLENIDALAAALEKYRSYFRHTT